MGRITASRKQLKPDPVYGSILASKFINCLMYDGKKSTAQAVFYDAMDLIKERLPDAEPIEVVRNQILSNLNRGSTNPNEIASRRFWAAAFPGHPYGRPASGTPESIKAVTVDDLKTYVRNVFARDNLTVGIVGDIDAEAAGKLIDRVFGDLPAKGSLAPVPNITMQSLGERLHADAL